MHIIYLLSYLTCSDDIFDWVDAETKNVIGVSKIEPLTVLFAVVHDANGRDMIYYLGVLEVEQIVATVVATVTETEKYLGYKDSI